MSAKTIKKTGCKLKKFLTEFDVFCTHSGLREHLRSHVFNQRSDLPRKRIEPITRAGISVRALQEFLL